MSKPDTLLKRHPASISLTLLLKLNHSLKKTVFSRHFYQEVNDKVLSKASTLDANLYFICYFTLLLSSILNNKHKIKAFLAKHLSHLSRVTKIMCSKAIGRPEAGMNTKRDGPSATEKRDVEEKKDTEKEEKKDAEKINSEEKVSEESMKLSPQSKTAVHLKAISSYISDIRIFNRLVDSIRYMPWIIDEFSALMNPGSAVPRLDRLINFGQSINCLILELLENAGWLTEHNWVATNDNNYWCIETYIWCSRVWGAYILIEIIELFRRVPRSKRNKDWRINLFTQVVQLPLVVHWSLYEGCLTPFWVGLCGSGASWFGFRNTWRSLNL